MTTQQHTSTPSPETLDVIFRADRKRQPEITAVFPSECGTNEFDMTCYVHVGQHGACSRGWYGKTRAAKPHEYDSLLRELQVIYAPEYVLRVVHRMTGQHADKRKAQMRGIEKGRAA